MPGTTLTITGFLGKEQCHTKPLCQKGIVMTLGVTQTYCYSVSSVEEAHQRQNLPVLSLNG